MSIMIYNTSCHDNSHLSILIAHSCSSASEIRPRSFVDMVAHSPQPLPVVDVPLHPPKVIEEELCVIFFKEEIDLSASLFRFSMVLKFLQ